jgi:GrpB-like predicted nucleotidyltransferase (UPF0157 family)
MIGLKRGVVELKPHNPKWRELYEEEEVLVSKAVSAFLIEIQHIGSTAIPGIMAKPIIDIALAIDSLENVEKIIKPLEEIGYTYRGEAGIPHRHLFVKGSEDFRTHHMHVMHRSHYEWKKHIVFRDYLRKHPKEAKEYSNLKLKLEKEFKEDRESYTESKSEFIESILEKAIQ